MIAGFVRRRLRLRYLSLGLVLAVAVSLGVAQTEGEGFQIGFRLLHVPQDDGSTLTIAVWYPTDAEPDETAYSMIVFRMRGNVAWEAPALKGPFPLVVYSHGGGACATSGAAHAEELAAHGFVVAGPDHADEFIAGRSDDTQPNPAKLGDWLRWATGVSAAKAAREVTTKYAHRPREISATIDAMLAASADPQSPLYATVDPRRIGITGVSFGAWTTLATTGMFPFFRDARIKAAAPIAGQVYRPNRFGDITNVRVPLLMIFGQNEHVILLDKSSPRKEPGMIELYEHARPPKVLVGITGGEHLHFGGAGASGPRWGTRAIPTAAEVRQDDPILRPTNYYLLAFFQRYLCDDTEAEQRLKTQIREAYIHRADLQAPD